MECADLSALWWLATAASRQVATDESGDRSPHSKTGDCNALEKRLVRDSFSVGWNDPLARTGAVWLLVYARRIIEIENARFKLQVQLKLNPPGSL